MYETKNIGKVFTSKFVGTGPSSYKKIIYRAALSQRLRNTALVDGVTHLFVPTQQEVFNFPSVHEKYVLNYRQSWFVHRNT